MPHPHHLSRSHPQPGTSRRRGGQLVALWAGLSALAAVVALGFASPWFAGHAHAKPVVAVQAASAGPTAEPATTAGTSVPPASEVFVGPSGDAAGTPQAPSF